MNNHPNKEIRRAIDEVLDRGWMLKSPVDTPTLGDACFVPPEIEVVVSSAFTVHRIIHKIMRHKSEDGPTPAHIPTARNKMKTYWFHVFLDGVDVMTDEIAETLFEAGCDDGLPSSSEGLTQVAFAREADSLESAIFRALNAIKKAGFDFSKVEIDPVSLHERSRNVA